MTGPFLFLMELGRKVYEEGVCLRLLSYLACLTGPKSSAITASLIPLTQLVSVNVTFCTLLASFISFYLPVLLGNSCPQ